MRVCLAPASVPADYDQSCVALARNGSYVLALAYKQLPVSTSVGEVGAWERAAAERDLNLLGFMTFDNFVKVGEDEGCCVDLRFWFYFGYVVMLHVNVTAAAAGRLSRCVLCPQAGRHRSSYDNWRLPSHRCTQPPPALHAPVPDMCSGVSGRFMSLEKCAWVSNHSKPRPPGSYWLTSQQYPLPLQTRLQQRSPG